MTAKRKAADAVELYDVCPTNGAAAVIGVPLDVAKAECRRLNAEARRPNSFGEPQGMHMGSVKTYEVVGKSGIVVA